MGRSHQGHRSHITILRGSLAPDGAVAKITGKEGLSFDGPAQVFDSEEDMVAAAERGEIRKGSVDRDSLRGPERVDPACRKC